MNFPFFIAKRYLISKKSKNIINIISIISTISIAVGTAALVIVLSVFNGFESVVSSMFSEFDSDFKITPKNGKIINLESFPLKELENIAEIEKISPIIEENALIRYDGNQYVASIKGVDSNYLFTTIKDSTMYIGDRILQYDDLNFAVVGFGIAYNLGIDINNQQKYVSIHIPKRKGNFSVNPENAFNSSSILPVGLFSVQQEYDDKYVFVPIRLAKELLDYENEISYLEVKLNSDTDSKKVKSKILKILPDNFVVKDRFEQQETVYKMMQSEKWAVFLILIFIIIVASFSAVGSLTMLIIEKERDIKNFSNLGASKSEIRKIFFYEGTLINTIGAIIGVALGLLICFLQIKFGFVRLGVSQNFIINQYPIKIIPADIIFIFISVAIIGILMAWLPARKINK